MVQPAGHQEPRARRIWQLCLALAVAALLSACSFATPKNEVTPKPPAPKLVLIGDSYSTLDSQRGVTYPWPEQVRDAWGVSDEDCTIYRHGGYGFGVPGHHFIDFLSDAPRDPAVTHVLIVGGAGNDRELPKEDAISWYLTTFDRLRELYPNAIIVHTITSWDLRDAAYRAAIVERIPWYKEAALQSGVVYLDGCETAIRGRPECFLSDGRHPSQEGQQAIGAAIIDALRSRGFLPSWRTADE